MSSQAPTGFITAQGLPGPRLGDQLAAAARIGPRRELYVSTIIPDYKLVADEGSYLVGTSPTPGTPLSYQVSAAFSDTVALLSLRNADGSNGKRIYLDYIRLIMGATVPASATAGQFAMKLDSGSARASAGTVLTPVNPNIDVGNASIADLRYNPTVAAVTGAARLISRGVLRSVIPVANDEWFFTFGTVEKSSAISLGGAVAQRMMIPCPPVVLGVNTNETFFFHVWFPGNAATAGQFELECGWFER